MKIYFFILMLIIFAIVSCTKEKKEICLNKEKTVVIDLSEEPMFNTTPFIAEIIQNNAGEDILIANFFDANFLYFFDLNHRAVRNKIPLEGRRLEGFHYVSEDSIFLLYSNQYNNGFIDSTNFVRIDTEGNIQEYYAMKHPQMANSNNDSIVKEQAFYPICRSVNLPATNEFVVLDLAKWYPEKIGTKEFMEQKTPVLAVYDYNKHSFNVCQDYWYPGIKDGVFYPGQYHSFSTCLSKEGNPLSRFYFSGTVTEWDIKNDILIHHTLKSQLSDSIYPVSEPRTNFTNELEAQYRTINYDPYRKLYFSVLWFNPNIYGYAAYSLIVADENFNYLGEIFNPSIGTWSPLFTEDYIVGFNDDEEGILKVDFYKLENGNISQSEYISTIRDSLLARKENTRKAVEEPVNIDGIETDVTLADCLNGFINVESDKYVLITIYVNESCPSCVNFVLKALEENKDLFNQYPVYFLLTSNNKGKMNSFLNDYDLSNCNYLVKDENGLVQLSTSIEPSNPRIQFIENDSIIFDTVYSPEKIGSSMIPKIFSFWDEEVSIRIITE